MRRATLLALLLAAACGAGTAPAEEVELRSGRQELRIALRGGLPVAWTSCETRCAEAGPRRRVLVATGEGTFDWVAGSADEAVRLAALEYRAEFAETPELVRAELTALEPLDGRVLVQRYELSKTTHEIQLRLEALPGAGIRLATGPGFIPPQLPGFGTAFSDVEAVRVTAGGQDRPGEAVGGQIRVESAAGEWLGVRSRFWAWLAQGPDGIPAIIEAPAVNQRALTWLAPGGTLALRFYAGPVEWQSLRVVSADLTQMLFAALWEPLRWLCFGLLFLLGFLSGWIPSPGLAIIALSLAVKLILAPLTRSADRWQQEVN
ncbi:MAG: hypothetical protein L6Q83_12905, partial [Gammaproteobacteria bacterium]|nr:hypothetical protein [Gammaproteobacteria bacterium]